MPEHCKGRRGFPGGALSITGRWRTVDEVIQEVIQEAIQ
jgi:hypothetical protein